jgi:AraC family transcriptional regulator
MTMHSQAAAPLLPSGNFYGQTFRQYEAGTFSLSETAYPPCSTLPRHSHESNYFCFVLSGTYTETYGRKLRSCRPSTIVYHPAGELHSQRFDRARVRLFRIEINQVRLGNVASMQINPQALDRRAGPAINLAHRLYQEFREPDEVSHLAIEGIGLELIVAMARQRCNGARISPQPPQWLRQAHELIASRFLEQLTLGDIARTVGVHPVTLAREFRNHYNCTVGDLIRRQRIDFACRQLAKPNQTLTNISISAGFYDQSHFAKTFKRLMGISPSQYRANFVSH